MDHSDSPESPAPLDNPGFAELVSRLARLRSRAAAEGRSTAVRQLDAAIEQASGKRRKAQRN